MQKATDSKEQVASTSASASASSDAASSLANYPMENNYQYVHGRVDPGFEESIHLVESIEGGKPSQENHHGFLPSHDEVGQSSTSQFIVSQGTLLHTSLRIRIPTG